MKFQLAADAVDVSLVPSIKLNSGARIPVVGMGTFGSDYVTAQAVADNTREAIALGYRHIDCASVYGNEKELGIVFENIFSSGCVTREDMWITSKVWNDAHDRVVDSCKQTLSDLRLTYLDLYLVHWPFANFHPPGCDVHSRSPGARPYIHENFMKTWKAMEELVQAGLVKHIGVSNMTIAKLELLLRDTRIKPVFNEMELHPHFQQPALFNYVKEQGIIPIGFCPVGSPNRPDRDKTESDTVDLEDPVLVRIARDHGVHPAVICIKWAHQRGQIPIPFSTSRKNIRSNLEAVTMDPLSEEEMESIKKIDKNNRLIKGQVFLWKDNQSWKDLWDEDGIIAS